MAFQNVCEIRVFETPWTDLPENIRLQFRESEKNAYLNGAGYFKKAARESQEPLLVSLFELLTDDDWPMWVKIETKGNEPPLIWYGFTYPRLEQHPQVRVAVDAPLPFPAPRRLERIYKSFGGIRTDFTETDGLLPPERMRPLSLLTSRSLISQSNIVANDCHTFFSYGNGDYLCVTSKGRVVSFDHETCEVQDVNFDDTLDDIFNSYLRRKNLRKFFGLE